MKDLPVTILKEGLNRRDKACIELEPSFDLAIAIHDYIQYINDHPVIDYLFTENIQADPRKLQENTKAAETRAEMQLNKVYKDLQQIVEMTLPWA